MSFYTTEIKGLRRRGVDNMIKQSKIDILVDNIDFGLKNLYEFANGGDEPLVKTIQQQFEELIAEHNKEINDLKDKLSYYENIPCECCGDW